MYSVKRYMFSNSNTCQLTIPLEGADKISDAVDTSELLHVRVSKINSLIEYSIHQCRTEHIDILKVYGTFPSK